MNIKTIITAALLSGCATTAPCPELAPEYIVYKCPQVTVQLTQEADPWTKEDEEELQLNIRMELISVPPECITRVIKFEPKTWARDKNMNKLFRTEGLFHFPVKVRIPESKQ